MSKAALMHWRIARLGPSRSGAVFRRTGGRPAPSLKVRVRLESSTLSKILATDCFTIRLFLGHAAKLPIAKIRPAEAFAGGQIFV